MIGLPYMEYNKSIWCYQLVQIIGLWDLTEYKHQIESKCMSVLPNPGNFNLFMVKLRYAHLTAFFFNFIFQIILLLGVLCGTFTHIKPMMVFLRVFDFLSPC